MRIRNPDGSEAGACGNATRCVAGLIAGETGKRELVVETIAGLLPAHHAATTAASPSTWAAAAPRLAGRPAGRRDGHAASPAVRARRGRPAPRSSMGNPHATFFVPDVGRARCSSASAPRFETDALFPQQANIGFASLRAPGAHPPARLGARRRPHPRLRLRRLRHHRQRRPPRRHRPRAPASSPTAARCDMEWRD
jgi:diaminopimelate epimerase